MVPKIILEVSHFLVIFYFNVNPYLVHTLVLGRTHFPSPKPPLSQTSCDTCCFRGRARACGWPAEKTTLLQSRPLLLGQPHASRQNDANYPYSIKCALLNAPNYPSAAGDYLDNVNPG